MEHVVGGAVGATVVGAAVGALVGALVIGDGGGSEGGGDGGSNVHLVALVSVCALLYPLLESCFQLHVPVSDQLTKARDSQQPGPFDSQNAMHTSAVSMPPYSCNPINPCDPPPPLQTVPMVLSSKEGQAPVDGAAVGALVGAAGGDDGGGVGGNAGGGNGGDVGGQGASIVLAPDVRA